MSAQPRSSARMNTMFGGRESASSADELQVTIPSSRTSATAGTTQAERMGRYPQKVGRGPEPDAVPHPGDPGTHRAERTTNEPRMVLKQSLLQPRPPPVKVRVTARASAPVHFGENA